MTNGETWYSLAKANHIDAAKQAIASWNAALTRNDLTNAEREFLTRALAGSTAQLTSFPDFHPGHW